MKNYKKKKKKKKKSVQVAINCWFGYFIKCSWFMLTNRKVQPGNIHREKRVFYCSMLTSFTFLLVDVDSQC